MYVKIIDDNKDFKLWVSELNRSFKYRSSQKIPYQEINEEKIILNENNIVLGVYDDASKMLGGAHISYCEGYGDIKTCKITHVWTLISCQK